MSAIMLPEAQDRNGARILRGDRVQYLGIQKGDSAGLLEVFSIIRTESGRVELGLGTGLVHRADDFQVAQPDPHDLYVAEQEAAAEAHLLGRAR